MRNNNELITIDLIPKDTNPLVENWFILKQLITESDIEILLYLPKLNTSSEHKIVDKKTKYGY